MNILVTINRYYITQLEIMIYSLKVNHPNQYINIYLLHHELTSEDIKLLKDKLNDTYLNIIDIELPYETSDLYTTKRYPVEMYDRLFAPLYLPKDLDRILYLDPDIIIKGNINDLYNMDFEGNLFMGASHIEEFLTYINEKRLNIDDIDIYANTGVLHMNLELLRPIINQELIINTIEDNKNKLILPDQDIITILFNKRIKAIDTMIYNLSDRILMIRNIIEKNKYSKEWIASNTKIIHYCGRNKPWKDNYYGILDFYYHEYNTSYKEYLMHKN